MRIIRIFHTTLRHQRHKLFIRILTVGKVEHSESKTSKIWMCELSKRVQFQYNL